MSLVNRFEDLHCWQDARELTREIYRASKNKAFFQDFALRDQIRKACISITSNIAEGFERSSKTAFLHFLSIAKGSAGEVRSQLYVALDEKYIDQATFDDLQALTFDVIRQIAGLMRSLESALQETSNQQAGKP